MSRIPMGQECMEKNCTNPATIKVGELYFCQECNEKLLKGNPVKIEVRVGSAIRVVVQSNIRPTEIAVIFTEETLKPILSNQTKLDQFIEWLKLEVYPSLKK